jgi:YD repeat-containing protein
MIAVAGIVAASGRAALAQGHPIFDAKGTQPNRDYFTQFPFEQIDTATGGLTLSFTDLAVPGNAGREFRFQRTFNSKSNLGVTLGISGLVLQVLDPGWTTNPAETSPTLYTADGETQALIRLYATGTPAEQSRIMMTDRMWRYDRQFRELWMPDGSFSRFDTYGRLIFWQDAFSNAIAVAWTGSTQATLTQSLGGGEQRVIVITYAVSCDLSVGGRTPCAPASLTLQGTGGAPSRTWTYSGEYAYPPAGTGPPWRLERGPGGPAGFVRVTTPSGGVLLYTMETKTFPDAGGPLEIQVVVVRFRDVTDVRGGLASGRWTYDYTFPIEGGTQARITTITDPVGTQTRFEHSYSGGAPSAAPYPGRHYLVTRRTVTPAGASAALEDETRTYTPVALPAATAVTVPELQSRTLARGGQTYSTTYTYASTNYGDYHTPSTIVETGQATRTTTRVYQHGSGGPFTPPYIVARLQQETVTSGGLSFVRSWDNDMATGFVRSETVYGIRTDYTPDPSGTGNVTQATKANGKWTRFTYSSGQVKDVTTPEGVNVSRVINPDGTVASQTQAGRTTTFTYDALSRPLTVQPPGGSYATYTTYNTDGSGFTVRRGPATATADDSSLVTVVDGFGRPLSTENALGIRTVTQYDALGRTTYQSHPFTGSGTGVGRTFTYDGLGRVTCEGHPGANCAGGTGPRVRREYVANTVRQFDENGRLTVLTQQAFGDPDEARLVTLADAAGAAWTYTYNTVGSLRTVTGPASPNGNGARTWVYDSRNLLTSETHPESGTVSYTYDAAGVLASRTDANSTRTYAYDGNDRVRVVSGGGQETQIEYEAGSDNRTQISVVGRTATSFGYDTAGRLIYRGDSIEGAFFETRLEYDADDNVTGLTYPTGRGVRYAYDAENRLTRIYNAGTNANYASAFTYHPSGALTGYTAGNGMATTISVDASRLWVTSIAATKAGGPTMGLGYGYDAVGNVTALTGSGTTSASYGFGYDALDRLTSVTGALNQTFAYDAHGNRTSTAGATYGYLGTTFRLGTQNATTMTYDGVGNLKTVNGASTTLHYTPDNMLKQFVSGSQTVNFSYDADQWRAYKRTEGGQATFYVRGPSGQLLTEWANASPTAATAKDYIYAGTRLIGVHKGTSVPRK